MIEEMRYVISPGETSVFNTQRMSDWEGRKNERLYNTEPRRGGKTQVGQTYQENAEHQAESTLLTFDAVRDAVLAGR